MEKSLDPGKIGRKITTKDMIMCALFTALIAVGAFIKVPVPVVPFTLQFLFTMLAGLIMGGRLGAISVGLYAVLGLVGLAYLRRRRRHLVRVEAELRIHHWICPGKPGNRADGGKAEKPDHGQTPGGEFHRACHRVCLRNDLLLYNLQLRDRNADRILASVFILLPAGGAGRYLSLLRRGISCKAPAPGISEDPELIARRDTAR